LGLFLTGLAIGFSIAAPVGPVGLMCIQRTLSGGRLNGLFTGLGAACADAFYGAVAGFGLTFISSFLMGQQVWLKLFGGLFLVWLGWRMARQPGLPGVRAGQGRGLWTSFSSTFFLALTSPATILLFMGAFAGLGIGREQYAYGAALSLVLGVFLGSAAWWLFLSWTTGLLRERILRHLGLVNKLSGATIAAFGMAALVSLAVAP
jgi:threonine/homoserine/homoserine lactone efflux protein